MTNDLESDNSIITEEFNNAANPKLNPTADFNKAAAIEPHILPPSTPKKVMALTPGGTLEQVVHTVVDVRSQVSPQLRDPADPRSLKAEAGKEQAHVDEQSEHRMVKHDKYEWVYIEEPGIEAYQLNDNNGDAIVYVVPAEKPLPLDYAHDNAQLRNKDFQSGEWKVEGGFSLQEALDRGEAHAEKFYEQEKNLIFENRMRQRGATREKENDRGDRGR